MKRLVKTKGTPPAKKADDAPPRPGVGPLIPAEEPPAVLGGTLLRPAAEIDALVESFKQYNILKDRLLEPTDFMWHVKWMAGSKQQRKVFKDDRKAKKFAENLRKQHSEPELEKRIVKSGCMKLSKAFTISTTILEWFEDRERGIASYKIRAWAANGQQRERTGSCDRQEKGKSDGPFDHISATANTRAEDRAIMALLGGETTSEEFEEHDQGEREEKQDAGKPGSETTRGDAGASGKAEEGALKAPLQACLICGRVIDAPEKYCPQHGKLSDEEKERLTALNQKFVKKKEAQPYDERKEVNRRFWSLYAKLHPTLDKTALAERMHGTIQKLYEKSSLKDLSLDQYKDLVAKVADQLNRRNQ